MLKQGYNLLKNIYMVLKAKIMRCDMENVSIERQYQDSQEIYSFLLNSKEISYATYVNEVYKKVLVLSPKQYQI